MTWLKKIDKGQVHPGLVSVMESTLMKLEREGNPFKAYSGLRTFAEQDRLYAQGRTTKKEDDIVTKARGGQSMHNYGLAVDSAPFNLLTEEPDDLWWPKDKDGAVWYRLESCLNNATTIVGIKSDVEYEWGGRWNSKDSPHVQVRTTLTELQYGHYPHCADVEWLVKAHTTFLFDTPWMRRRVQHLLNMQSYNAGVVDGIIGTRTVTAIQQFSRDQEIKKSGDERVDGKNVLERLVRLHQAAVSTLRGTLPEDLVG